MATQTIFDDLNGQPDQRQSRSVFDDLEYKPSPPKSAIQLATPGQPSTERQIPAVITPPKPETPQGDTNLLSNPIAASGRSIREQFQSSAKLLTENIGAALNTEGGPLRDAAMVKATLGALGVLTAPLSPGFALVENTGRTVALAFLKTTPGGIYDKMVERGYIDPKSNIVNLKNIATIAGKDRPSTGNAAIDIAADILTPLPPVTKGVSLAKGLFRGTKAIEKTVEAERDLSKVARAVEEIAPEIAKVEDIKPVVNAAEQIATEIPKAAEIPKPIVPEIKPPVTPAPVKPAAVETVFDEFAAPAPKVPTPKPMPKPTEVTHIPGVEPEVLPMVNDTVNMRLKEIQEIFESGMGEVSGKVKNVEGIERMTYEAAQSEAGGFGKVRVKSIVPEVADIKGGPAAIADAIRRDKNNAKYLEIKQAVTDGVLERHADDIEGANEMARERRAIMEEGNGTIFDDFEPTGTAGEYVQKDAMQTLYDEAGQAVGKERDSRLAEVQNKILQAPEVGVSKRAQLGIDKQRSIPKTGEPSLFEEQPKDLFGSVGGYTTNRSIPQVPVKTSALPATTGPKFVAAPQGTALAEAEKITQVEALKPSAFAKLKAAPRTIQKSLVSEFTPVRELESNVMEIAGKPVPRVDLARKFEQVAGAQAQAEADLIDFRKAVVDPIRGVANDFNTYLFLQRTASRLRDNPVIKKVGDWTVEKAETALSELKSKIGPQRMARLEEAGKAMQIESDKALRLQVESGRMSPEVYDRIKASNDFYARFKVLKHIEDAEMAAPGTGRKIANTQDLTKAITGIDEADLSIGNIVQATAEQIVRSRILAEKNKKMLELDKLVDLDKTGQLISRAQPTRYYKIETDEAGDILRQLGLQQTARSPQLLEHSFVKVGKAIQYAEEVGLKVKQKNLPSSLGRATLGGINSSGRVSLKAFTSDVITHELGHSYDEILLDAFGDPVTVTKNVFGKKRDVIQHVSSAINTGEGKRVFGQNSFQKELSALTDFTGLGGNAKYRSNAKERFAEFVNLYIHDPKKAKELAPTWTDHFESSILPNHQVKGLVEKLSNFYQKVDKLPNIMTPLKELDDSNYLTTAIRKAFPDRAPQIGVRFGTKPKAGNEIVTYFKDGKETAIEVSKEVAQAIQGMNAAQTGLLAKALMTTKIPLQWGATSANAAFQVRNLLFADLPRAALMSRYGIQNARDLFQFPADWAYSLFTSVKGNFGKENALYMDWLRSGAANSTIQRELTPSAFKATLGLPEKMTAGKIARIPKELVLDNVAKFSNAIEETSKILGLKRGIRIEEIQKLIPAAANEKMMEIVSEVRNYSGSPDFARKGADTKNLNLLFMFFNARMQGAAADISRLAGKTGKAEAGAAWARLGVAVGIPATLLALVNQTGDMAEHYKKIPEWERKNNFMIPTGKWFVNEDGIEVPEYYRIPKREITSILGNMIESAVEFAAKADPKALGRFAVDALETLSPVNIQGKNPRERLESVVSSANPLLKTPTELATGRDTFRHFNVVPQYMEGAPTEEQYRETTPKPFVALGNTEIAKRLGLSPLHIELLTRSASADGFAQFSARKPDIGRGAATTNPITKMFYRSGKLDSAVEDEAYTKAEQMETAKQLQRRREAERIMREWQDGGIPEEERKKQIFRLLRTDLKLALRLRDLENERERQISFQDKRAASLGIESGARAQYIASILQTLNTNKEREEYLKELRQKKVLTAKVYSQVRKQMPELIAIGER